MKQEYSYGDTILTATDISLSFGEKLILRDINLEIKDIKRPGLTTGQVIGFLGPSGRGKTQLFKILAGLNKPTTGSVILNGAPVKVGDVGVVAQHYPLMEHRTVWSNLEMVAKGKNPEASRFESATEEIEYYLDRFGMYEHKDKYPAQLSGGQRQRIAIIQQLLCSESFILLDEPFSGLDPLMTEEVCFIIQQVADLNDKNTIVVVSHDIPSTIAISSELWLLGYEYDKLENGKRKAKPGATIRYKENLMEHGLAWRPDIQDTPEFFQYVKQIRHLYKDL